jgi:exodeoxyribonuclease VII small subunit
VKKEQRAPKPGGASEDEGPTFEAAMQRLGEIVEQLESGELPLDDSLRLFEEGVSLSKRAGSLLDQAERKVEALTKAADGSLGAVPFPTDSREEEE